ncbi:TnsA endonuclease N-terminal domain-containing protein [Clostridium sp. C8-1-8]|uniref:TnsA endonuclease N-terminal domain-containing protein n=1 Tax=Clostridium sp. C8-1-8 TaxID=2698831 RepID=UPI00136BA059|nr:TnsA endonuclease N-terminal domain-containing protein [Clostridium sp. C8-1-8]
MAVKKKSIEKKQQEGRGQGFGKEYTPWIKIQEVPSLGRRSRFKGIKTDRQHELLSDLERNYLYLLEYSDKVFDVREQYSLPMEETLSIALELGLEHPREPGTGEYIVMTTDFLITLQQEDNKYDVARTIKDKDKLLDRRTIEKFEIEKVYWERKGISWGIVTEADIDKTIAENIMFFSSYYNLEEIDAFENIDKVEIFDLVLEYIRRIIGTTETIRTISTRFDKEMSLLKGTGISIFKHLLARKIIKVELNQALKLDQHIEVELSQEALKEEFKIS